MGLLDDLKNTTLVQLFKHVPWLSARWARSHRFLEGEGIPWTPVKGPLPEMVIALVTTAGVHLRSQEPFDMDDPNGDLSYRVIPSDVKSEALVITHKYYDHSAADRDINVVLPLDRLRELKTEGRIGGLASFAYSFMGHIDGQHLRSLVEQTAPAVARRLRRDGAQAVFLTPV
jgi:D-proline reductase (dithiol) PrdB